MVSVEFSEGITESLDILEHMDRAYIDKIPRKFMEFLENNKSTSYISNLDHSKKLNEMSLKEKTKDLLAILYLKYWCTEQEKSDFSNLLRENEIKYQDELKEKYNVDKIFKNTNPSNPIPYISNSTLFSFADFNIASDGSDTNIKSVSLLINPA